nr:uncharacterized protein LOC104106818 [Nicotiana tomentosiformis]
MGQKLGLSKSVHVSRELQSAPKATTTAAQKITRPTGALPNNSEKNPIEHVQAINLRSGRELEEPPSPKHVSERELVPKPVIEAEKKDGEHMQEIEERPPPPFPQSTVLEYRVVPPKLKDPGCFTIPLAIGKDEVGRALCDLGASINLLPLSLLKKLNLGAPRPTTITLPLAGRSLPVLEGIIEDVLVRVGKFIFNAYFIILDYMADEEVPIILGQPFLATGGALIDMRRAS